MDIELIRTFAIYLFISMAVSVILAALLLALVWRRLQNIQVPPNAGFAETLRYTPFSVVLIVDLLDLGLDFLAAPVAWVLLDRLGLKALRGVSVIEALIPFTQPIPTMTLSWLAARLFPLEKLETGEF